MRTIRNLDVGNSIRALCMGCSWSYRWPGLLGFREVTWEDRGGGLGLYQIRGRLAQQALSTVDWVIVQLPTPIRSVDAGRVPLINTAGTLGCFSWFLKHFEGIGEKAARAQLLDRYVEEIHTINAMHPRVLFFVFNTGGYPFRSPFDFGVKTAGSLLSQLYAAGIQIADCDLEGQAGYAMKEHEGDRTGPLTEKRGGKVIELGPRWSVIDPPGYWIEDPHPNRAADKLAAATVETYIHAHPG